MNISPLLFAWDQVQRIKRLRRLVPETRKDENIIPVRVGKYGFKKTKEFTNFLENCFYEVINVVGTQDEEIEISVNLKELKDHINNYLFNWKSNSLQKLYQPMLIKSELQLTALKKEIVSVIDKKGGFNQVLDLKNNEEIDFTAAFIFLEKESCLKIKKMHYQIENEMTRYHFATNQDFYSKSVEQLNYSQSNLMSDSTDTIEVSDNIFLEGQILKNTTNGREAKLKRSAAGKLLRFLHNGRKPKYTKSELERALRQFGCDTNLKTIKNDICRAYAELFEGESFTAIIKFDVGVYYFTGLIRKKW